MKLKLKAANNHLTIETGTKLIIMKIKEVRGKYPDYKISLMPKADYEIGITDTKINKRRKDKYEEIFIASNKRKYWLLYPNIGNMTGSFKSKKEAVAWFVNGGR